MSEAKHTPGPWCIETQETDGDVGWNVGAEGGDNVANAGEYPYYCIRSEANARLIAAAPTQHEEMLRYLPVIERAEADPELWARLTDGLGIATANGYRAAIAKAEGR